MDLTTNIRNLLPTNVSYISANPLNLHKRLWSLLCFIKYYNRSFQIYFNSCSNDRINYVWIRAKKSVLHSPPMTRQHNMDSLQKDYLRLRNRKVNKLKLKMKPNLTSNTFPNFDKLFNIVNFIKTSLLKWRVRCDFTNVILKNKKYHTNN